MSSILLQVKRISLLSLCGVLFLCAITEISLKPAAADRADTLKEQLVTLRRQIEKGAIRFDTCLLYTSPSPRDS